MTANGSDLQLLKPLRRGDQQGQVKLVQEWLCLNGEHVSIDGDFGPATESAVKDFQKKAEVMPPAVSSTMRRSKDWWRP